MPNYIQLEQKSYQTLWHTGNSIRADSFKKITLPFSLPQDFGIGISLKLINSNIFSCTFWQCGDYRCFFDISDSKIKITNGTITSKTNVVTWNKNDFVGIYAGRKDGKLFIQTKIAGVIGDKIEATSDFIDSGIYLYIGSLSDGSENINAIIGNFVVHNYLQDINSLDFLNSVPGGGA